MDDELLDLATNDLLTIFRSALGTGQLNISFEWEISEKTISEIGGRLIEDYILTSLPEKVWGNVEGLVGSFLECNVPESQRAMEDIAFV